MMRTDEEREERPDPVSDRRLWQEARLIDAPEDEAGRFLDLAGFADGLLDAEDRDRVAVLLAADPEAAADVEAASIPAGPDQTPADLDRVVARACAISPEAVLPRGRVVVFDPRRRSRLVQHFAQWGSIAAAIAVAGWLGFSMGSDTSLALSNPHQASDTSFLPELFDPANGFLGDLGEGLRS